MKNNNYQPPKKILAKYADVLVNFALNSGKGIKEGDVVECTVPDVAKPLALELQNAILRAGGHPRIRLIPTMFTRDYFEIATDEQLTYFPENYLRSKAELLDHTIGIIAEVDPEELKGIDPHRIMLQRNSQYPYRDWLFEKERKGKFTWTAALWGTTGKAKVVGLSLEEYWNQIVKACFLDQDDPIATWKKLVADQKIIRDKLDELAIREVKVEGPDVDLTLQIGENRAWKTGYGSNIPSFEHFTSPDWRGTTGWIRFDQPLYRFGYILKDIELEFKQGRVIKAKASKGGKVLESMLKSENADRVGEFSLTDKRFSRITHVMAETLFDENIGGPHGNTHIALGMAYKDCFKGDASKVSDREWEEMGYNNSPVHTDIISTTERVVTATAGDGGKIVIYKEGSFTL